MLALASDEIRQPVAPSSEIAIFTFRVEVVVCTYRKALRPCSKPREKGPRESVWKRYGRVLRRSEAIFACLRYRLVRARLVILAEYLRKCYVVSISVPTLPLCEAGPLRHASYLRRARVEVGSVCPPHLLPHRNRSHCMKSSRTHTNPSAVRTWIASSILPVKSGLRRLVPRRCKHYPDAGRR